VEAAWRLDRRAAVIEMARASGLDVVGGPEGNDAVAASTYGTGELIAAAVERGAREIVVAVGGSATTDGGLGALRALEPNQRLRGIDVRVACDVRLPFIEAAEVYGPQKGASPAQVELLRRRLERLAQIYEEEYGVDVTGLVGGGAAGGLAGGLAAVGAHLEPGFDLVADAVDLDERMEGCDLVVTGEGFLDEQSFDGKVVGGVVTLAAALGVPVLVVAGDVMDPLPQETEAVSLTERFGGERSRLDTLGCIEAVVRDHLAAN
jgi:glycerate kinase